MKKLIVSILLLNTFLFGSQEFKAMIQKAIPFGWELGKTTCQDIEKEFPLLRTWKHGTRRYGIEDTIDVQCNMVGFRNKLSYVTLYTNTSFRKLGFNSNMNEKDVENHFLQYFKKNQIEFNTNTAIKIDDIKVAVSFDYSDKTIDNIYIILEHNEF